MDTYKTDANGIIVSPGKFEGCPAIAPKLWEQGLEGFASDAFEGGYGFVVEQAPAQYFQPVAYILTETDNGFVYLEAFYNLKGYRKVIEGYQNDLDDESNSIGA